MAIDLNPSSLCLVKVTCTALQLEYKQNTKIQFQHKYLPVGNFHRLRKIVYGYNLVCRNVQDCILKIREKQVEAELCQAKVKLEVVNEDEVKVWS